MTHEENPYHTMALKRYKFLLALGKLNVALGLDMSSKPKETDISKLDMEKEAFTPKPPIVE